MERYQITLFFNNCFFTDYCSSPSSDSSAAQDSYNSNGYFRITGGISAFPPQKEDRFATLLFPDTLNMFLCALNTTKAL